MSTLESEAQKLTMARQPASPLRGAGLGSAASKITRFRSAPFAMPVSFAYTMRYSPQLAPSAGARSKRLNRPIGMYLHAASVKGLQLACAPSEGASRQL